MKKKANNGFLAIGAKARLSQNPDVRPGNDLSMATRAFQGEVDTGTRMKPCKTTQNPYFPALQASQTAKVC